MKSSTRDEAEGKLHQVKGKIKEIAGNGVDPICSFADHIEFGLRREEGYKAFPEDGVVFCNHHSETFLHRSVLCEASTAPGKNT